MSYLDKQAKSFDSALGGVASRIGSVVKKPPPSPTPSVQSTNSAAAAVASGTTPTKKPTKRDVTATIFSQPENTGVGQELGSNILYIVEYLKKDGQPKTFDEILGHLSLHNKDEQFQRTIKDRLLLHSRVRYIPDPDAEAAADKGQAWRTGRFEHLPIIPGVKSKTSLVKYLQSRLDAQGVSVKDLKDGWPDCEDAIAQLEVENMILVVRTKKDGLARMVWNNDPSLCHPVDDKFRLMWERVEVPPVEDIVRRLTAVGQKPTSEDPRLKVVAGAGDKKKAKKRVQRNTGKSTNTHMEGLLKDYSHLRK